MTFRWFGKDDPIPLEGIRQIPGVKGIVSALYDVPVGQAWSRDAISRLAETVDASGLRLEVIESIPVHEDIKLGLDSRERYLANYAESIRSMGEAGIPVLCYNFMPVFDWTRTDLAMPLPDGSTALAYDDRTLSSIDLSNGTGDLPGWAAAYDAETLAFLFDAYSKLDEEAMWENLCCFLEYVVPVAEENDVKLAIHPDDPPWKIFGLPRIITDVASLNRVINTVESPANGITFCTGSLGALADNDLVAMAGHFAHLGRIHFAHCRNITRIGERSFHEVSHPTEYGDVDMFGVLRALANNGFNGLMRPDHGRMIWNEDGRPGYGLYDRALGATYLHGLWEGITKQL
jgi:mannonate dehydratase